MFHLQWCEWVFFFFFWSCCLLSQTPFYKWNVASLGYFITSLSITRWFRIRVCLEWSTRGILYSTYNTILNIPVRSLRFQNIFWFGSQLCSPEDCKDFFLRWFKFGKEWFFKYENEELNVNLKLFTYSLILFQPPQNYRLIGQNKRGINF